MSTRGINPYHSNEKEIENELLELDFQGDEGNIHEIYFYGSGVANEEMKAAVLEILSQYFRPEFINRVDESVVFHPLGRKQIYKIAQIQIEILKARLGERDIKLELTEEALDQLADSGFDPVYGARPLKRAIQQSIENGLAQEILAGRYAAGDTVHVTVADGEFSFS